LLKGGVLSLAGLLKHKGETRELPATPAMSGGQTDYRPIKKAARLGGLIKSLLIEC
jgi:hypothetical protein